MEIAKQSWYKTTGGKVGIAIGAVVVLVGGFLAFKYFTKEDKKKTESDTKKDEGVKLPPQKDVTPPSSEGLPLGAKIGDLKTDFDRTYNYIKANGIWYTISKDKVKIPAWKSLADNKTATDLLNNKYPN